MRRRTAWPARLIAATVATLVAVTGGLSAPPAQAAPAPTVDRALFVQVTWKAGNGAPAAPVDRDLVELTARFNQHRAWFQAASRGKFSGWQTHPAGPIEIEPPHMDAGKCHTTTVNYAMAAAAKEILAQSVDLSLYSVIAFYTSQTPCGPAQGQLNGKMVWLNGSVDLLTVVHELGHIRGLWDGNGLACVDASGKRVPLSASCTIAGYVHPFSAMGRWPGAYSAFDQYSLGWLLGSQISLTVPPQGGTRTLLPLGSSGAGVQAIHLNDGGTKLWVEYRQPIGIDAGNPFNAFGVLIHLQRTGGATEESILLDMTPQTTTFTDARLAVGATWVNPLGTMKITVNSAGPTGAVVAIGSTLPRVPDVVGSTLGQATEAITAAGLTRGAVTFVVDHNCNYIGRVMSQTPVPGSYVEAGTAVKLTIGSSPSHPCP